MCSVFKYIGVDGILMCEDVIMTDLLIETRALNEIGIQFEFLRLFL